MEAMDEGDGEFPHVKLWESPHLIVDPSLVRWYYLQSLSNRGRTRSPALSSLQMLGFYQICAFRLVSTRPSPLGISSDDLTVSLLQWLSHSKKQYCELCGHVFHFQKGAELPRSVTADLY